MRAVSLDRDVIVFVSCFWQTTCTAVRAGDEAFVIDSLVYPDELEALASALEQARFPVSGLLVTHGDWDHLLGRLAFPDASLGCGESTARRLAGELGEAQRQLRAFDEEQYVDGRGPLALAGVQSLPVPGHLSLGSSGRELELHAAGGHTADGVAYLIPWLGVLVCGDHLSPVEIPMISEGGSLAAYMATLDTLRPLVARAETVVPGHGGPLERAAAQRILDEDAVYLEALRSEGTDAPLPPGRRTSAQRRIHEANARRTRP